jgi:hypothetical protein
VQNYKKATAGLPGRLARAINAITYALDRYSDLDLTEEVCADAAEYAWKLLTDAGIGSVVIRASDKMMGKDRQGLSCADHEWVRVGNVNIDFAAQQFGLPFPYVTISDSQEAKKLYGKGSVEPSEEYEIYDYSDPQKMIYPTVEMIDKALKTPDGMDKLDEFWGDDWQVRVMNDVLRGFRAMMGY